MTDYLASNLARLFKSRHQESDSFFFFNSIPKVFYWSNLSFQYPDDKITKLLSRVHLASHDRNRECDWSNGDDIFLSLWRRSPQRQRE